MNPESGPAPAARCLANRPASQGGKEGSGVLRSARQRSPQAITFVGALDTRENRSCTGQTLCPNGADYAGLLSSIESARPLRGRDAGEQVERNC